MAFSYQALETDSIRLLTFNPERSLGGTDLLLKHVPRDQAQYVALSYCWGSALTQSPILLNGQVFLVTENLWDALTAIWTFHREELANLSIWIDAICIDQDNVLEKNFQVAQMWRIYSEAQRVLAWLGPATPDVESLSDIFCKAARNCVEYRGSHPQWPCRHCGQYIRRGNATT